MLEEGMKIKIFPETNVESYVRFIREQGYKAEVYRDYIKVGKKKKRFIDRTIVGTDIRKARKKKGITREQLAEAVGVSVTTVFSWEIGRTAPRAYNYDELKKILDLKGE